MLHFFDRSLARIGIRFQTLSGFLDKRRNFFCLFLASSCALLVRWIDLSKDYAGWSRIASIGAPLAIIVLLSLLCIASGDGTAIGYSDKRKTGLLPAFVFTTVLLFLAVRAMLSISVPYHNALSLYGKEEPVTGKVVSYVPEKGGGAPVLLQTQHGLVSVFCETSGLRYGDRIHASILFSAPSPRRNPGGFDETGYYFSNGIYLKGALTNGIEPLVIEKAPVSIAGIAYAARSKIIRIFEKNLPPREASLLAGLLLGDRSGMSREDTLCYQRAGLSHITAVSGSGVTFLMVLLHLLLGHLKIPKRMKLAGISFSLLFFGFITAWTPSVTRALIMVLVLIAGNRLHRKVKPTQALFIAVVIVLAAKPVYALQTGFWLSGAATAGIVMLSRSISDKLPQRPFVVKIIRPIVSASLAASLSVMPLAVAASKELSLSSVISGIPVLPLVEAATLLGSVEALAGMTAEHTFLTELLSVPLKGILYSIYKIALFISKIDFLHIKAGNVTIYWILAAAVIVASFYIKVSVKKRICMITAGCLFMTGFLHGAVRSATCPPMRIIFADVGQGDATLVLLRSGESILIDSGGEADGAEAVEGILDYYGIAFPSVFIATHTHKDHCGAMSILIRGRGGNTLLVPYDTLSHIRAHDSDDPSQESIPVNSSRFSAGESDVGKDLVEAACERRMEIREVGAGDVLQFGEQCKLTFYHPQKNRGMVLTGNESSLVIRIECLGFSILINGDAPGDVEQDLIDSGYVLNADIYRISHHGSPSSTNHDIINAVSPKVSVISVGANFYGHPSPKVIARLESADSKIFRTDHNGAVMADIREGQLRINPMIP